MDRLVEGVVSLRKEVAVSFANDELNIVVI